MAHRERDPLEMFFTLKAKRGPAENWAGPPLFVGGSLRIGETATRYPRGEWVEVTVYAPGHGPGEPVMVIDQGEASLIRSLAAEKRGPELATTDIYCEVECFGNREKPQHRGTPTWDGDQLEIDGNVYPPGEWSKVTVFCEGWAARQRPQLEPKKRKRTKRIEPMPDRRRRVRPDRTQEGGTRPETAPGAP